MTNCVGLGIIALVPIVSLVLSLVKSRTDVKEQARPEKDLTVIGRFAGIITLLGALIVISMLIIRSTVSLEQTLKDVLIWASLTVGIITMLISNFLLDKYNTSTSQISWSARWAGIISTIGASASVAIILTGLSQKEVIRETITIRDKLSGVSYIILAVVFLIIIGGLAWCFYKALTAASRDTGIQHPDEVGDELLQQESSDIWDA